ncbi:MAG: AraC family transcriptional regulator, partial [Proteobacteria bacterium]|nr:AraC family transcriptional regulator [Pseudomonadota bacterium]
MPRVLRDLGCPLAPVLEDVGLPPDLFDDDDASLGVTEAFRLLNRAAERASCPHLGLLCGAQHRPETIGLAGRLAQNARDVGSALRGLALNLHLNGHVFVPTVTVAGDTAAFVLALIADVDEPARASVDLGFAGAFSIVRAICGPGWAPLDVLMVHAPAGSRRPYDRFFGTRVQFGCDRNAIVFDRSWLTRPVHGANPATLAALERELAVIAQANPLPLPVATRRALLACLARGEISVRAV